MLPTTSLAVTVNVCKPSVTVSSAPPLGTVPLHAATPEPPSTHPYDAIWLERNRYVVAIGALIEIAGAARSILFPPIGPAVAQLPTWSQTVRVPVDAFGVSVPAATDVDKEKL